LLWFKQSRKSEWWVPDIAATVGIQVNMPLFLTVELGDELKIGRSLISFEEKSGRRVRMKIDSQEDVEHVKRADEPKEKPTPALTRPRRA